MATVCRCDTQQDFTASYYNCTIDDTQEPVRICKTLGTNRCFPGSWGNRRKRDADDDEQEIMDDDTILPDDIPVPEYYPDGNYTELPSLPTWPTPSGITEQQARDACQRTLESSAAYNICREYVDLEPVVVLCVRDIQVRDDLFYLFYRGFYCSTICCISDQLMYHCTLYHVMGKAMYSSPHIAQFPNRFSQTWKLNLPPKIYLACRNWLRSDDMGALFVNDLPQWVSLLVFIFFSSSRYRSRCWMATKIAH